MRGLLLGLALAGLLLSGCTFKNDTTTFTLVDYEGERYLVKTERTTEETISLMDEGNLEVRDTKTVYRMPKSDRSGRTWVYVGFVDPDFSLWQRGALTTLAQRVCADGDVLGEVKPRFTRSGIGPGHTAEGGGEPRERRERD